MVDAYIELICDVLHDPLHCSWERYHSYKVAMEMTFLSCCYFKFITLQFISTRGHIDHICNSIWSFFDHVSSFSI